jgi:acetyl esterase/lipase
MRDSGLFRNLMDNMSTILGLTIGVSRPSMVTNYLRRGNRIQTHKYGRHPEQFLSILNNIEAGTTVTKGEKRVLLFVHGGAWGSGQPWMYRLVAAGLAEKLGACSFIVIGYPVYPKFTISEQSESVLTAIRYIRRHQRDLGLPDNAAYILAGHSSGANICALALFSSLELKVKAVDIFIGLSGVYDIEKHYLFEASRGVHELSPMGAAANGRSRHWEVSPTRLLARSPTNNVFGDLWPKTLLIHGQTDTTVPYSSTTEFALRLQQDDALVVTSFPENVSRL